MFPKFEHEHVSYEELYKAYIDCRKHKRRTANAASFQVNLSENLYKLWVDLNKGYYKIGKSIAFIVDKPVKREVFAADFRDRIVHHLVINRMINSFERVVINNSFSCRKGKGVLYGVKKLEEESKLVTNFYTKDAYVLKCDLKSFFMTINKSLLCEKIDKLIRTEVYPNDWKKYNFTTNLAQKIINNCPQDGCIRKQPKSKWFGLPKEKSLFTTPRTHGLPIGNLTSQIFANFFLTDFDKFIYNELGFKYYGRYVDDFYILSNNKDDLLNAIPKIKNKLKEIGINLHPNKLYLQNIKNGVKFIGAVIKPNRVYAGKRTIGNLKYVLEKTSENFKNKDITIEEVNKLVASFNSYMGFLKHHATFKIRKKIITGNLIKPFISKCYFDHNFSKMIPFQEYSYYNKGISYKELMINPDRISFNHNYIPVIIK